jgi:hypothetical protein
LSIISSRIDHSPGFSSCSDQVLISGVDGGFMGSDPGVPADISYHHSSLTSILYKGKIRIQQRDSFMDHGNSGGSQVQKVDIDGSIEGARS